MGTLNYVLKQEKREESKEFGKWYARAVHHSEMSTDELAQVIQRNASVKRADVLAVLAELSEVMSDAIQSGRIVVLDGIGRFKAGIATKPASTAKTFTAAMNIVGARINFQPEVKKVEHKFIKKMLEGIQYAETAKNDVEKA